MAKSNEHYDPTTDNVVALFGWSAQHMPAAATQATCTIAAAGPNLRNVVKSITACIAAGANAQTPINVVLRDGATGVGNILWSGALSAIVNSCGVVEWEGELAGSPNTQMTLEFTGAGVAASLETVAMNGVIASAQT
jgi:hypothetical protein